MRPPYTAPEVVNVAIVGTGFIAETRARVYAGAGGAGHTARLVAAVSHTQEHAEAYAARHGIADAYSEIDAVLERPDVDVVDLCVPNYLHRSMTEAAARAGKHVICAKPLTAFDGAAHEDPASLPRAQGHRAMMQDFVACIAEGRGPVADGELGLDAIRVVYAAYVAAEEGRRVEL
jgi:predicted dehydrogenase